MTILVVSLVSVSVRRNLWAIKINLSINISIITLLNYNASTHPPHSDYHHRDLQRKRRLLKRTRKGAYANDLGSGGSNTSVSLFAPQMWYNIHLDTSRS